MPPSGALKAALYGCCLPSARQSRLCGLASTRFDCRIRSFRTATAGGHAVELADWGVVRDETDVVVFFTPSLNPPPSGLTPTPALFGSALHHLEALFAIVFRDYAPEETSFLPTTLSLTGVAQLAGPSGVGKTHILRALCRRYSASCHEITASAILRHDVYHQHGDMALSLSAIWQNAIRTRPCLIIVDNLDILAPVSPAGGSQVCGCRVSPAVVGSSVSQDHAEPQFIRELLSLLQCTNLCTFLTSQSPICLQTVDQRF